MTLFPFWEKNLIYSKIYTFPTLNNTTWTVQRRSRHDYSPRTPEVETGWLGVQVVISYTSSRPAWAKKKKKKKILSLKNKTKLDNPNVKYFASQVGSQSATVVVCVGSAMGLVKQIETNTICILIFFVVVILSFFNPPSRAEYRTQGLVLTRQMLYHWAKSQTL